MPDPHDSAEPNSLIRKDETLDGAAILRLLDKPLAADDLREATDRVAHPLELKEQRLVRLLVFQLGQERMAFESVKVDQVTRASKLHRIPHRSNKILRGLCHLDGELMLCGDLAQLLELEPTPRPARDEPSRTRMIVLGNEQNRWVVEVDAIEGVTAVVRDTFRPPPITVDAALSRYTQSLVTDDGPLVVLLDVDRVLSGLQAALR